MTPITVELEEKPLVKAESRQGKDDARFTLPRKYTWEQFESLELVTVDSPGLRLTYLDGNIEFMTVGKIHEKISRLFALLLALYFRDKRIEFFPIGSATCQDRDRDVSFQPDESFYIGEEKDHPDLAIEIIITSGSIDKLAKYKRFQVQEVWFWENDQLAVYQLDQNQDYQLANTSNFLPDVDLKVLANCVQMSSTLAATDEWIKHIQSH
jgi:Uma2 family endonuclease